MKLYEASPCSFGQQENGHVALGSIDLLDAQRQLDIVGGRAANAFVSKMVTGAC
jgi:hypothetical protein